MQRKAADQIVSEAIATRDELMDEAKKEAEKCLAAVQAEVDAKLADGKRKYIAVQDEMNEIVELINQAQIRFMASYKEVHKIVSAMPETMRELEDEEASRKKEDEKVQLLHRIICRRGSRSMKKISTRKRKIFPRKR